MSTSRMESDESEEEGKHSRMRLACSPVRFANAVRSLSPDHKAAVHGIGLGGLLHLKPVTLRREMLVKVAKRYDVITKMFRIGGKDIPMTPSDVNYLMGLPIQGEHAKVGPDKKETEELFDSYKTNNKIMLTDLENKVTTSVVADDDFKRQFTLFAIGTILAPTTKNYVDSKYLILVKEVQNLSKINWGYFTLIDLLNCVHSFKLKEAVNLQGNLPLLQFWFWEHVQAESRYGVFYSPMPPPLMARWDEENARRRDIAFKKDEIDGGVVVTNISVSAEAVVENNANTPTTMPGQYEANPVNVSHEVQSGSHTLGSHTLGNQQMDMILQMMNEKFLDLGKKIDRGLLSIEHKFDNKIMVLNEEMATIKTELKMVGTVHIRMSKAEDDLSNLNREFKDIRTRVSSNTASTSKAAHFQEPSKEGEQCSRHTAPQESFKRPINPIGASNPENNLQNKTTEEAAPKETKEPTVPQKPIIVMDWSLTEEDKEIAQFLTLSYDDATIARIDGHPIAVKSLRRNVAKEYTIDQVINAYAYISKVETRPTDYLTTYQSRTLSLSRSIPPGNHRPWMASVGKKCKGLHMLFVPLNVKDNHWVLVVVNFRKKEIQILNSLPSILDKTKETNLVHSLQACIDKSIEVGFVNITDRIDLTQWPIERYTNIPQQTNGYSCGVFVMKYMSTWDGQKITEPFTQANIDIFSWKVCTRILLSKHNLSPIKSYKKAITREDHLAMNPEETKCNDDEHSGCILVTDEGTEVDKQSKKRGSTKRKRGRPRKLEQPPETTIQQFSTDSIADRVQNKNKGRVSKPSRLQKSPYKQL